jgi:hypothetical protein
MTVSTKGGLVTKTETVYTSELEKSVFLDAVKLSLS